MSVGLAGAVEPAGRAGRPAGLPGIDAQSARPRGVLLPALAAHGEPSHAYLFHGPAGDRQADDRAGLRGGAAGPTAREDPDGVAERVRRGSHPDLTWVTPSGAAEMLVSDIEEPVVAAADPHPRSSRAGGCS